MAKIMKIAETLSIVLSFCLSVPMDISVKHLLKQPLHNHTHLFIKAHTKSRAFLTYKGGGQIPPSRLPPCAPAQNHILPLPPPRKSPFFLNLYKKTNEE